MKGMEEMPGTALVERQRVGSGARKHRLRGGVLSVRRVPHDHWPHTPRGPRDWRLKLNYSSIMGRRDKRPLRRRYSSMGGPTMPDPNGSTTVDSSSRDKPTSLGKSSSPPPGEKKVDCGSESSNDSSTRDVRLL